MTFAKAIELAAALHDALGELADKNKACDVLFDELSNMQFAVEEVIDNLHSTCQE